MSIKSALGLGAIVFSIGIAGSAQADLGFMPAFTSHAAPITDRACDDLVRAPGIVRDRAGTTAHCKYLIAEHNAKVVVGGLAAKSGKALHDAKAELAAWERTRLNAFYTHAHEEYEHAKSVVSRAQGQAKQAAEAALQQAEHTLNGAVSEVEKHGAEIAHEVQQHLAMELASAEMRAQQAKSAFMAGVGEAKEKLEGVHLRAEQAVKHLQDLMAKADFTTAKQKFAAAKNRVGQAAEALKASAQHELERAKQLADQLKSRFGAELHALEGRVKQLSDRLRHAFADLRHDLSSVGGHIMDHVNGAKDSIAHVAGSVAHGLKDALASLVPW